MYKPLPCCSSDPSHEEPWLTGPLLTPSSKVVKKDHYNIEPYLFFSINNGRYGSDWRLQSTPLFYQWNPQIVYKVGLSEKVNLAGNIQGYYNRTQGESSWAFGDLPVGLDYQFFSSSDEHWFPHVKLSIQETFPTGKYQKLNPRKLSTDSGGQGTYGSLIGLTCSKLIHFHDHHYLNLRFNISSTFYSPYLSEA